MDGLIGSARKLFQVIVLETLRGEDYWIPKNNNEIVEIQKYRLPAHKELERQGPLALRHGKYKRVDNDKALYHVTMTWKQPPSQQSARDKRRQELSLLRTADWQEAMDLYQACLQYTALFEVQETKGELQGLLQNIRQHPLWQPVHIAAKLGSMAYFANFSPQDPTLLRLFNTASQPEGRYPLHLAVERDYLELAKMMVQLGASIGKTDVQGCNAVHYAATASGNMLEALCGYEEGERVLNALNKEGCTPLFLAVRHGNPLCVTALIRLGGELNIACKGWSPVFEAVQQSNLNKAKELIQSVVEASRDVLEEKEPSTGNTCLHAASGKVGLAAALIVAELTNAKIDVNAQNLAGKTALHIHTKTGNLSSVVTLAARDADLDAKDANGNTALHIAVSNGYLDIVRALLCLGANPNILNATDDSPRHVAAKLKTPKTVDIVKALSICGAERCPLGKVGCSSACAEGRSPLGLDSSDLQQDSIFSQEESAAEIQNGTSILNLKQKLCIESLHKKRRPKNLLSLDGGGIRGLVFVQFLISLEDLMGENLWQYFDWVAGTSTGSFVAAGLAIGKSLRECQHLYLRFKDQLFEGFSRPYNSFLLEEFIKKELGGDKTLADIDTPKLAITRVKADKHPVKLELMRNYRLPLVSDEENDSLGYVHPKEQFLWKCLRCSSAAPTYFSSVDGMYVDGGLMANNPTLDLLAEVQHWNMALECKDRKEEVDDVGVVLSLGTGRPPDMPIECLDFALAGSPFSAAIAIRNLGFMFVDQCCATEGCPVERARSWCHSLNAPFFRLTTPMSKDILLDTTDDVELVTLMWDTLEFAKKNRQELIQIAQALKATRK